MIPSGHKVSVDAGIYLAEGTVHRNSNFAYQPEPLLITAEQNDAVCAYMKYRMTKQPDTSDDAYVRWMLSAAASVLTAVIAAEMLKRGI